MPKSVHSPVLTTFAVQLNRGEDRRELHLLPDGEFKPAAIEDARKMPQSGTYRLTPAAAARVIALAQASTNDLPIDYEHQTQQAAVNGQPAPAAGWMQGAKLVYRPGEGLFALDVEWTKRAQQYLDDDEYRYQSATFMHDPVTGEVLGLVGAALTNRPALDGLTSARLAALSAQLGHDSPTPEDTMNPILKALLDAQITTLRAAAPDPAKYVAVETVTALNSELTTLRAKVAQGEIDQIIDQAKAEGKVASEVVEKTWRDIGTADLAQLKALVGATPANPVLGGKRQSDGKQRGNGEGNEELTQAELAVCASMGLTAEQFKAGKALATG